MIVRDYIKYLECRYERTNFREPKEQQVPSHYYYIEREKSYLQYKYYILNKKYKKKGN